MKLNVLLLLLIWSMVMISCHSDPDALKLKQLQEDMDVQTMMMMVQNDIIAEQKLKIKTLEFQREAKCPTFTVIK